tara:strand:- start:812 stop:1024 length:213 start_codon:yes stop_codon:yes gene_type:complete
MEQVIDIFSNQVTILIERIFWLGLGGFLGLALITSFLRGLKESKKKTTPISLNQLENPAKKANEQNSDNI